MKNKGEKTTKKIAEKTGNRPRKTRSLGLYYLPPQRKIVMQVGKAEILPVQCSL